MPIKHWFLFVFIFAQNLFLAQSPPVVTNDANASAYFGNNKTTFTWNHTTTTASNRIILVFVTTANRGGTASGITSVTYGGTSMTLLASATTAAALKSYLYYILNPNSGTNSIIVTPIDRTNYFAAGSASFYNVKQEEPAFNTIGGTANTASGSIATPYQNDLLLGFCGSDDNTNGIGTGQTLIYNVGSGSKVYVNLSSKTSVSTSESFSITLASQSSDYEVILARLTPFGAAVVLPATISNYELNCKEELTSFNWSTSSELNNDFFTIEKSEDAINFTPIAKINGNATSNEEHHYQFTDEELNNKPFYYRLKQTDFDGKSETFKPLLSTCFNTKETTYFPNPVKDKLHITSHNEYKNVSIYSIDGKLVKNEEITSINSYIELSNFSSGMYYIQLSSPIGNSAFFKFVKE